MVKSGEVEGYSELSDAIEGLQPHMKNISSGSFDVDGHFGCALKAAVSKSYNFCVLCTDVPEDSSFFLTPSLRGICEDLICFSYLLKLSQDERESVVKSKLHIAMHRSAETQREFFSQWRAWQPVVEEYPIDIAKHNSVLKAVLNKFGWNTRRKIWPSVWHMADVTSYKYLYKYLYSATSRMVHFDPQVLLRTGWGGNTKDELDCSTVWEFSTSNFSKYYSEFNQIYSAMLFLELCRGPANKLFDDDFLPKITNVENALARVVRWPELLTYEELNIKGPNSLFRIMLRVEYEGTFQDSATKNNV